MASQNFAKLSSPTKALADSFQKRVGDPILALGRRKTQHGPTLGDMFGRFVSSALLIGLAYAALYVSVGEPFYYGGPAWSAMLIWAAAQGCGWMFGMMHLPALLGMLVIGLVLKNGAPSSVAGLPRSWSALLRTSALGVIFMRSGVELDLKVFKRVGGAAVRLLLIPGLTEAAVTGALAIPLLSLPTLWGFSLGFILKAVGPAIIITTMSELQKQRLGTGKGIPSIIIAAASFDDMVAITGYGLFSNFAFAASSDNLGWQIAHGPVEIVVGTIGGIVGGVFCSCTRLWRTRFQRTMVAFFTGQVLIFTFYRFGMRSAGPLSSLVTGMVLRVLMDRGAPGFMSSGADLENAHMIEKDLGIYWRWVAQPLLFGIIGTLVNLRSVDGNVIPRALALIATGLAVRIPTSFLAVSGANLTVLERVFVAIAWTPKATVQAALGPLPLDTIMANEGPNSPNIAHAEAILTTSVLAILMCATLGVLGLHFAAPRCLAFGTDPSPGTPEWKAWKGAVAAGVASGATEEGGSAKAGTALTTNDVPLPVAACLPAPSMALSHAPTAIPAVPGEDLALPLPFNALRTGGGVPSSGSEAEEDGGHRSRRNSRRVRRRSRQSRHSRRHSRVRDASGDEQLASSDGSESATSHDSEGSYSRWRSAVGAALMSTRTRLADRLARRSRPSITGGAPPLVSRASLGSSPSAPAGLHLIQGQAAVATSGGEGASGMQAAGASKAAADAASDKAVGRYEDDEDAASVLSSHSSPPAGHQVALSRTPSGGYAPPAPTPGQMTPMS